MLKKWEFAYLSSLIICFAIILFASFSADCADIRSNTLRLHIRANSDSQADQNLKLEVRDALLEEFGQLFADTSNEQEALSLASKQTDEIQTFVSEYIKNKNFNYDVKVYTTNMYFSTTEYEDFTMPAGNYDALRIDIGKAIGHNWFCVMYPQLCISGAKAEDSKQYTSKQVEILQSDYKIKFAVLEFFEKIKTKL